MSGLEAERLQERIRGMTEEQMKVVAGALPDEILWEAVHGRFLYLRERVAEIHRLMGGRG